MFIVLLSLKRSSFLGSVFALCLTFSPKMTIFPSFKEWDQKQSKFELDLGFAVLKIPNFDDILLGVEASSACFEAESPEPSCQMVKSDNFFEACVNSETASCASPCDSYTLQRDRLKCG